MNNLLVALANQFPRLTKFNFIANIVYPGRKMFVEALESGEFPQIRGILATKKGYCAWGVACEIYRKNVHDPDMPFFYDEEAGWFSYDGATHCPPSRVVSWLGLGHGYVHARFKVPNSNVLRSIPEMNDMMELTFPQIAAVLRKNWGL